MKYERLTISSKNIVQQFENIKLENRNEFCLKCFNRLAELEDDLESGKIIRLPCKVGDTVYNTDGIRVYQGEIMEISLTPKHFIFTADTVCFDERAIGTRVFLTREEAEKRLKELQE